MNRGAQLRSSGFYSSESLDSLLTSEGKRSVGRLEQRGFAPARRHVLHRLDVAAPYQQRIIEIVHRRANVPRKEIQRFPDLWTRCSFFQREGRCSSLGERGVSSGCPTTTQVGMPASADTALWPSVAGDDSRMWTADHACQYQHRRTVAVVGELLQAGGVAINNGPGETRWTKLSRRNLRKQASTGKWASLR